MKQTNGILWTSLVILVLAGCADDSTATGASDAAGPAADAGADAQATADAGGGSDTGSSDASSGLPGAPWEGPVTEAGGFHIGFRSETIRYVPEGESEERALPLRIWYPTDDTEGDAARYAGGLVTRDGVFEEAALAAGGPFPVMAFSHGSSGIPELYMSLTEHFATHGWIVVGTEHVGNTFLDLSMSIGDMIVLRPQDIEATLDWLERLPEAHIFAGQLDQQLVLAGHSFGGYTALAVAATDDRIDMAMLMAPWLAAELDFAAIDLPTVLFTGELDATTPNVTNGDVIWSGISGPDDLRVHFATGAHHTFDDVCAFAPQVGAGDGCGADFIDVAEAFAAVNAYTMAFARDLFWGDDTVGGILDGSVVVSDDVTLTTGQ